MKHSIRIRFTAVFVLIIFMLISSIILVNTFGLELFYRNAKVRDIQRAYQSIDALVMEHDRTDISIVEDQECSKKLMQILEEYSYKYNISIAIIDSVSTAALFSSERDSELLYRRVQVGIFDPDADDHVKVLSRKDNNVITLHNVKKDMTSDAEAEREHSGLHNSFIESFGYLSDNQTMIIMSTPVAGLEESVSLSNSFFLYIGLFMLALGMIVIYFLTKRITRPILELSEISQKMGRQDFEAKYLGDAKDEIGILGKNMNCMSDNLRMTIEELRLANEQLKDDIRKKDEIDRMRRDFIANVSHELKTPIALIQGYAEGLQEGMCEDEESRKYYTDVIMDEADKMNKMVKQLLTLSALESGMQKMNMAVFDLNDLIQGVIDSTSILLADQKTRIIFAPKQKVLAYGDEFKIEEVVTNYISNAIHHTPDGGEIRVDIEPGEKEQSCRISVSNTGKAIPDEDLDRVWEKFYKVDKAHTREYGGSGIGLSIVRAIVEAHEQHCGVENTESGVRFWFSIAMQPNACK